MGWSNEAFIFAHLDRNNLPHLVISNFATFPKLKEWLWLQPFFTYMHRALKPGGIICTQVSLFLCLKWTQSYARAAQACWCAGYEPDEWSKLCKQIFKCLLSWIVWQGESLWLHLDTIKELTRMCRSIFEGGDVRYAFTTIPTYPRYSVSFQALW